MPHYRVLHEHLDRPGGKRRKPGDVVELPARQGMRLAKRGLVVPVRQQTVERAVRTPPETATPRHVGGGWYELPSGERVQGRAEAMKRMQE